MSSQGEVVGERSGGVQGAAPGEVRVVRALLSVSDKHGIVEFAAGLREQGVEIISTGGTARGTFEGGPRRCGRSRTSRASRRSWTAASRPCTRACMRACWHGATSRST